MHASQLQLPIGYLLVWAVTGWILRSAVLGQLMGQPNDRSSHSVPAPHGCTFAKLANELRVAALALCMATGWVLHTAYAKRCTKLRPPRWELYTARTPMVETASGGGGAGWLPR